MAWLVLVTATIILWVISLCKTLYFSRPIADTSIFRTESEPANKRRNTLLVIAHPDDESMFFSPTLLILGLYDHNVHILCISTGNADGRGEIRKRELYRACTMLQVPRENIKIVDHEDLQDGFGKTWDHRLLARIIGKEIITWDINVIITFDSHGVSGHCNHRDVHYGVRMYLSENSARNIEAWELDSEFFKSYSCSTITQKDSQDELVRTCFHYSENALHVINFIEEEKAKLQVRAFTGNILDLWIFGYQTSVLNFIQGAGLVFWSMLIPENAILQWPNMKASGCGSESSLSCSPVTVM